MQDSKDSYDFSIITPVFNGEHWISKTVESVLEVCANFRYEYIVINDGSSDGTKEILSAYSKEVKIINQENQGEAASVNNGLNLAQGKYVIVVSADDPMRSSDLLRLAKATLDNDRNIVCVYPSWSVIDSSENILRNVDVEDYSEDALVGEFKCLVGPGGAFRRETALQIGGRRKHLRFTSDYDFWLRLSQKGPFQRIPGYLAYWREHESSTSIAYRGVEMANERIFMMEEFLNSNPRISKEIKKNAMSNAYYQAALLVYFDAKIPAKRLLAKALLARPRNIFLFQIRIVSYISLMPFSKPLLKMLRNLGLFGKIPANE
jgi:glycosyltransferase involved in cell wall biosynthesis